MITEFGGFKIGDRVRYINGSNLGTVVRFDSAWLKENPDAYVFGVGVLWDEDDEECSFSLPISWHPSSKLVIA